MRSRSHSPGVIPARNSRVEGATATSRPENTSDNPSFAVTLGLAVVAHTFHEAFTAIKFAGAAYLLYLAYRMWTAPAEAKAMAVASGDSRRASLLFGGMSVSLGNPKVAGFYLALLPNLIDLGHVDLFGYAELAGLCVAVLTLVLGAYALAAARARALFNTPRAVRLFNRTGGALMAGAAIAVASK